MQTKSDIERGNGQGQYKQRYPFGSRTYIMSSTAIATMIKIMESLPESAQERVVDHLREYIEELRDEIKWDIHFEETREQLEDAARCAKRKIAEGQAKPLDYEQL